MTEVKLIKDKATGLSAGYGFIAFAEPAAAAAALRATAGRPLFGQAARVNWAFAKADRARTAAHAHLFVGDLPSGMTDRALRAAFVAACGPACSDARVMWDHATGRGRGYGFVAFRSPADAAAAIDAMNGALLGGRRLRVGWAAHRLPGLGSDEEEEGGCGGGGGGRGHQYPYPAGPGPGLGPPSPPPPTTTAAAAAAALPPLPSSHPTSSAPFISLDPAVLSAASPGNTNVYVGGLPPGVGEGEVVTAASVYGRVTCVRAFAGAGFAFVEYGDHAAALAAIIGLSTDGWTDGRALKVAWGRPPASTTGGRGRGGAGGLLPAAAPAAAPSPSTAAAAAAGAAQAALLQQYVALGLLPPPQVGDGGGGGGGAAAAATTMPLPGGDAEAADPSFLYHQR